MSRIKLTAGGVRDFTTTKTQEFRWDTEAPGLGVRATNTGAKAYIFQGKLNGQAIRITIGNVDTWPLESVRDRKTGEEVRRGAREEARRLKALLVDRSINMITYHMISRSNFFQRNTTGAAFISSMPLRMRALSSWMEATRRWRRKVRAIFEKAHSIRLSQEPCLGV